MPPKPGILVEWDRYPARRVFLHYANEALVARALPVRERRRARVFLKKSTRRSSVAGAWIFVLRCVDIKIVSWSMYVVAQTQGSRPPHKKTWSFQASGEPRSHPVTDSRVKRVLPGGLSAKQNALQPKTPTPQGVTSEGNATAVAVALTLPSPLPVALAAYATARTGATSTASPRTRLLAQPGPQKPQHCPGKKKTVFETLNAKIDRGKLVVQPRKGKAQ